MNQRKSNRAKYASRPFRLVNADTVERVIAALRNAPIDAMRPLRVLIGEEPRKRSLDANAAMWAGPLRDIAEQAWIDGKQFPIEVWAHYFKVQSLPEEFDPELCLEGYCKWSYGPDGERVLTGSTTQLTPKGFAQYVQAMEAFGGNLGVHYSARPFE